MNEQSRIRLPIYHADASKHVGEIRIYTILLMCLYIYIYVLYLLVWIMNCTRRTVDTPTLNTLKELFRFMLPYEYDIVRRFQAYGFNFDQ